MNYKEIQNLKRKLALAMQSRKEYILPKLKKGYQFRLNTRMVVYEITGTSFKREFNNKQRKYVDTKEVNLIHTKIVTNRRKHKTKSYHDNFFYIDDYFLSSYRELAERDKLELL